MERQHNDEQASLIPNIHFDGYSGIKINTETEKLYGT